MTHIRLEGGAYVTPSVAGLPDSITPGLPAGKSPSWCEDAQTRVEAQQAGAAVAAMHVEVEDGDALHAVCRLCVRRAHHYLVRVRVKVGVRARAGLGLGLGLG